MKAKLAYVLLVIACLGDFTSTVFGISRGYQESRPYAYPFGVLLVPLIFGSIVWLFNRSFFASVPALARRCIIGALIAFAFTPLAWNLCALLGGI